ncbi:MAG: glycosyltransferase family 2 protein [Pseudomonadota bacterium]
MGPEPRVSVVSPFYNTGEYLAEAIESVLALNYTNFEYILVNNKSTDDSREIALRYASRDPRIKFFDNDVFLAKRQNYNAALKRIGADTQYVKMLLADDALYPDCLRELVAVGERDPKIGLVSSYCMNGDQPWGGGLSRDVWHMAGREVCRLMLLTGCFLLGTPSVVLYRADIVRKRPVFFEPSDVHADTMAAYQILLEHDLGFVHQIQSFCRTQAASTTGTALRFNPGTLDYLIAIERVGPHVLSPEELRHLREREWAYYWGFLGRSLLFAREPAFWEYHRKGLATIGQDLKTSRLVPHAILAAARLALNPLSTVERGLSSLKARRVDHQ